VAYLQCPQCRLTVAASAYYLRGDECPRCLTAMLPYERFSPARAAAPPPAVLEEPGLATAPVARSAALE
jgi:hypothetical protein